MLAKLSLLRELLHRNDSRGAIISFVALIIFMAMVGPFCSDMYVPALPAIARSLQAAEDMVQLSISSTILGLSIAQLLFGTLSDRYGRRSMIILGFAISIIGTTICIFATDIWILIAGRFVQGMGLGSVLGLSRTLIRDLFTGKRLAQVGSYFGMAFALSPAIAPVFGAYLQAWFGWRAIFVFLLFYTLIALSLVLLFLPETNRFIDPTATRLKTIVKNYKRLLTHGSFIGYTI